MKDIEALDFIRDNNIKSYMLYTVVDPVTGEYDVYLDY